MTTDLPSEPTIRVTYKDTLDYLFSQLPMYQRVGKVAFKKDLGNIKKLCTILDDPHKKIKTVHIAGTNGKGSVAHMLASILTASGYKTGLYTSPHLKDFRERIRINGEPISEGAVISFVQDNKIHFERIKPSFFEMTVAMAFDRFAKEQVDIAIIETGLGGRFDSTNIITPLLSIITNISYDHMDMLGDTLAKIAFEKAGIIKKNVPVIISEYLDETAVEFKKKAAAMKAPIFWASKLYEAVFNSTDEGASIKVNTIGTSKSYHIGNIQIGHYQSQNIPAVFSAIQQLSGIGFQLNNNKIEFGLENIKKLSGLRGRWEIVSRDPLTILDCAHNEAALSYVMEQAIAIHKELHIVFGTVIDKPIEKIFRLLPMNARYYFCKANIPRALDIEVLEEHAAKKGLAFQRFESVSDALIAAQKDAGSNGMVLATGSSFIVAEVVE